jgi:hypothetical protein
VTIAGTIVNVSQGGPCAPTLSTASQSFASTGGTGTTTVTAADWCTWTAVSNDSWITVTSGASNTGNRAVSFEVSI